MTSPETIMTSRPAQMGYKRWDISVLRKPKFKTKNNHFENSHDAENCKRATLWAFQKSNFSQNIKKMKGAFGELQFL